MEDKLIAIEVIDIEKNVVKELILRAINSLNSEIKVCNYDLILLEYKHRTDKREIKEAHQKNKNYLINCTEKDLRKQIHIWNLVSENKRISEIQSATDRRKNELKELYDKKFNLRQKIAYYNAVADTYKIMLYK